MAKYLVLTLSILLSACGMKSTPQKAEVVMPLRTPKETVTLVKCQEGYACLDIVNFKQLLVNDTNTEIYIEQLLNLLNELAEPVKP